MATNTAASFTNHTGNGTAGPFSISFSYLSEAEVDVTVGGVLKTITTHYTFTSATQITFTSGNEPGNGVAINIQRDTNITAKKVDFNDGSVLTESDLDTQNDQILFAVQENLRKLDTIEESATGDQTAAEIRTLVESATDSNVFTDADHTKLNNIEASATADQTASEIRTLVESASDSNVFTDADHTKLNAIEANATADQTNSEIKTAYEANSDTNAFTDAEKTKLSGIETGATADQSNAEIKTAYEANSNTNAFTDAEKTKLAGIEASATADQSNAEIKTAYEANSDTNVFTDAEKTKLGNLGSLNALSDVNTSGVADGKILKYDASASEFIIADDGGSGGGGASAFTGLSDTPANFGGAASKTVKVNAAGNALEFVTVSTDVVDDTTPQLGGNLDVQTNEITTSTTNGNVKVNPNGTGVFEVKGNTNAGTLQLNCESNSHGVKIKSPPHSAGASYTLTLPNNDGDSNGQTLATNGNGVLSWQNTAFTNQNQVISLFDQSGTPVQRLLASTEGVTVQGTSAGVSKLMFRDRTTANFLKFKPVDTLSATVEFTLPSADGSNGQFLRTNGSGVLSFATIQNSNIVDSANSSNVVATASNGNFEISGNNKLAFDRDTNNTNKVAFQAPSTQPNDITFTLPAADGSTGQFLKTNGSGVLSFADGGGGATGGGGEKIFHENENSMDQDYTIGNGTANINAGVFGPLTINATLTIPATSVLSIV